jgi:hypothetical protein
MPTFATLPDLQLVLKAGPDGNQVISDPDGLRPPLDVIPPVSDLVSTGTGPSSMTVAWSYVNEDKHDGFRTEVQIAGGSWQAGATLGPAARGWAASGLPASTSVSIRVIAYNETYESDAVSVTDTTKEAQDWQLPAGHYHPSEIPIEIIGPRPDNERTHRSRYNWAHPGMQYAVPIAVLGGSYPHYYEIVAVDGPASLASATIGGQRQYGVGVEWYETQDWEDYGTLRWTPAAGDEGQDFSFTIRVTGQDGLSAEVTFSGQVNSAQFVFVDSNGAPGGDGTVGSPFLDFDDLWTDNTDTRFDGKIIVFREGIYDPGKASVLNLQNNLNLPCVFIGWPGEGKWVMEQGKNVNLQWSVGRPDLWLSDCYVDGNTDDTDNNWFWKVSWWNISDGNSHSRCTIWNNVLYNHQGSYSAPGDGNGGWFSFLSPRWTEDGYETRVHYAIIKNVFDTGYPTTSTGRNYGSCVDFYGTTRSILEHNVIRNWNVATPIWMKLHDQWWSVRANSLWENNETAEIICNQISQYSVPPAPKGGYTEVCWNFRSAKDLIVLFSDENQKTVAPANPQYLYRNTNYYIGTSGFYNGGYLYSSPDAVPIEHNVLRVFDNVHVTVNRISGTGPWAIGYGNGPRPTGSSRHGDAQAMEWALNGVFEGTLMNDRNGGIDFTTGRLEGDWVEYRGQRGAYVE